MQEFLTPRNITVAVVVAAVGTGAYLLYSTITQPPEMPKLDMNKWWGKGPRPAKDDTSIRTFKIEFNSTMISDLKQRVTNRRPLTPNLEGIQSEYGINIKYLEEKLTYWVEKYDFKKREELLNSFPHYKTRIQGLDIHFIHAKPTVLKPGDKVLPLLMLHGWPSSSKEFLKVIPILTTYQGYEFVFEVVAVDLPGFGFSEGTNKPGLNPVEIGIIMRNLMKRLGFDKFYIQGGDWGSQCGTHMATIFPDEVLGFHTNMPLSSVPISMWKILFGSLAPSLQKYSERIYPLKKLIHYLIRESGYFHIQATKPDTIGVALTDSPSGLAAYIMEKMAICSNRDQLNTPHGGLDNLDLDDVFDTITIQWASNCIVTSMRLYAEGYSTASPEVQTIHRIPTKVPTAAVKYLYEIMYHPDSVLTDKFRTLVRSTTFDFGGHFAALQTPAEFAQDVYGAGADFLRYYSDRTDVYQIPVTETKTQA